MRTDGTRTPIRPKTANTATAVASNCHASFISKVSREGQIKAGDWDKKQSEEYLLYLRQLKKKIKIHPALEQAFIKLYGYTSNREGVRHALIEEQSVSSAEARFMLVCCSAFVNYILGGLADAGQTLKS